MAKGKHATALFEVIHASKQFGGNKDKSGLLRTPKWWFKGRPKEKDPTSRGVASPLTPDAAAAAARAAAPATPSDRAPEPATVAPLTPGSLPQPTTSRQNEAKRRDRRMGAILPGSSEPLLAERWHDVRKQGRDDAA